MVFALVMICTAITLGLVSAFNGTNSTSANLSRNQNLELFNNDGQRIAVIGAGQTGQGTVFLFNPDGSISAQLGSYEAGSEKGQSLIGLNDRNNNLRLLMRLHGRHDSPFIVMKDKSGDDIIVIGLEGNDETPVLKYRNKNGIMKNALLD